MNCHLIYTPFTGVGLHGGYRGDAWFRHRIDVFLNYTHKSLLAQTNKNFVHWLSFRPEDQDNKIVQELAKKLSEFPDYRFIMTFDGLMYHDDKFSNYRLKTRVRNFMMMELDHWNNKTPHNPIKSLKLAWDDKNRSLVSRIQDSLQVVKSVIGTDYEWIYLTRIDSDDLFHKETVDLIQAQDPEWKRALVFDKGYILNIRTKQVADWNPPTNPPFHSIIFPANTFFNAQAHYEYYGNFKSHEDIPKVFNAQVLDDNRYMVAFHGKHISTAWESPAIKKAHHKLKYGRTNPFKGYMYTTGTGQNISTHWASRTRQVKNPMIGNEYSESEEILKQFGL